MPNLKAYPQNPSELQIVFDLLGILTANMTTSNVGKKGKPSAVAAPAVSVGDVNELIITYPDGSKYKISVYATQLNKSAGSL
jgi:hypothetical protein